MILYHGSGIIVDNPRIIQADVGRDFGFGFYTTDIKEQAIRWAKRKTMILQRNNKPAQPTLNIFEYNKTKAEKILKIKTFTNPSMKWLEFIVSCRGNINFKHNYDIVIGNIANDNVGETVSYVMSGIMRKEDAVERLKFQKINNQICFNTKSALKHLVFQKSEIVLEEKQTCHTI